MIEEFWVDVHVVQHWLLNTFCFWFLPQMSAAGLRAIPKKRAHQELYRHVLHQLEGCAAKRLHLRALWHRLGFIIKLRTIVAHSRPKCLLGHASLLTCMLYCLRTACCLTAMETGNFWLGYLEHKMLYHLAVLIHQHRVLSSSATASKDNYVGTETCTHALAVILLGLVHALQIFSVHC